jgi:hypothetical protein
MVDIRQSFFIHQQSNNEAQWQKKELRIREYVKEEKNARRKGKNKERKKNSYYRLVLLSFGLARSPNIIIAIIREQARKNADAQRHFYRSCLHILLCMCMRRRAFQPMKYQQQKNQQ